MDSKKDEPGGRKPSDKKSSSMSNNLVWSLLALGIGVLIGVMWFNPRHQDVDIPTGKLLKLIKEGSPARNPKGRDHLRRGLRILAPLGPVFEPPRPGHRPD